MDVFHVLGLVYAYLFATYSCNFAFENRALLFLTLQKSKKVDASILSIQISYQLKDEWFY